MHDRLTRYLARRGITGEEALDIIERTKREIPPTVRPWSLAALALGLLPVVALAGPALTGTGHVWTSIAVGVIVMAAIGAALAYVRTSTVIATAKRILRERAVEFCHHCGFDLRNLPTSEYRCPECGTVRQRIPEPDSPG